MAFEQLHVELNRFCSQFSGALEPFASALESCLGSLSQLRDPVALGSARTAFSENLNRLKILRDKAQEQNSYLVIFGPLKSGKSTLMNAISGAYVSEVTSLPAYPCLVYVHEGEGKAFHTTDFAGKETSYPSVDELSSTIQTAHKDLAERIRLSEQNETPFNPAEHFPEAIRRIDFTLPAPFLQESGTILVDTPGLYTRMRYNYGQLTKDFRNTAACAVFVVKTDNLFYERVFDEFADLLEIFSRVFLVVNIDSRKQDLGPDGALQPSLESRDPAKIIETFQSLTLSARIRDAINGGRLQIYAIDLLLEASRRLQAQGEEAGAEAEEAPSTPAGAAKIGFPAFLKDLTEYLNSSDYITEFMADTLRQTNSVLHEIEEETGSEALRKFREGMHAFETEAREAEKQLAAVRELQKSPWDQPLKLWKEEIYQRVNDHCASVLPYLKQAAHNEIDMWLQSDESVDFLIWERLYPRIRKEASESHARTQQLVEGVASSRFGGLPLDEHLVETVRTAGLPIEDLFPGFQEQLRDQFAKAPDLPYPENLQAAIPVKKRVLDYLLFRSAQRVRNRLFGDIFPSGKDLPENIKAVRFGPEAKAFLHEWSDRLAENAFRRLVHEELEKALSAFKDRFLSESKARLDARASALEQTRASAQEQFAERDHVMQQMDLLTQSADDLSKHVKDLRSGFVRGSLQS